jgi:hypothetical protein
VESATTTTPTTTSATAPSITAAALKILETVALLSTSVPILRLALQVVALRGPTLAAST